MNPIPLFVIIPLGVAFLLPILVRLWKGFPDLLGNLAGLTLIALSLWALRFANDPQTLFAGGWKPIAGIPIGIAMVVDGLTVLMLLIVNGIGFLVGLYAIRYMDHYTDKGKYVTLFMLMMAGLNGVVLSGDLFNLFVFLEITAIASYSLVAFGVEAEELEASFKYQVLGGTASAVILLGIALFYHVTGTLNMADAALVLQQQGATPIVILVAALFMAGFSLKAALMPFHAWLPDAHPSAPAPISAMLSGVVIKVLGVYALVRLFFNVFRIVEIPMVLTLFLILGLLSMVAGALLALGQKDIKRLLAYSSISQIGYVIFAIGLGTPMGILGGLFHLLNHAVLKSLLFLNSGAVVYRMKTRNMDELGGLMQRMPVTGSTALVGSFSISGIPPMGGFWSKLIIILAALQAGRPVLAGIAVLASVITLAYYMKFQKGILFGTLKETASRVREVPFFMGFSMVVLALISIGLGILLLPALRSGLLDPAVKVLTGGLEYAKMVMGG